MAQVVPSGGPSSPADDVAGGGGAAGAVRSSLGRHPVLVYTTARLLLFVAAFALLALVGARGFLLLLLAFLISGLLSLVLLDGPRSAMAGSVGGYFSRLNRRIEDSTRAEDLD